MNFKKVVAGWILKIIWMKKGLYSYVKEKRGRACTKNGKGPFSYSNYSMGLRQQGGIVVDDSLKTRDAW